MTSKTRATVVATAVILGMVAGFCAAYVLLTATGLCPRSQLCATPLTHAGLAFVVVPFVGMGCAFLVLRVFEGRAKMRDSLK
ncbi:MAG TPA: hypothetical protein VK511_04705 [Gemmatimonadaceae bacterium]|nr:hypothetical protein [Gemmatimonadaceae bacterium]